MGSFSDTYETKIMNALFGNDSIPALGTVYLALYTTSPGDTGAAGVEVAGNNYARASVGMSSATTAATIKNLSTATFQTCTLAAWGTVTAFALWTATDTGTMVFWSTLTTARTVDVGDQSYFATGSLTAVVD